MILSFPAFRMANFFGEQVNGSSGIGKEHILNAVKNGIAKINVGTEIRQSYENGIDAGGGEIAVVEKAYTKTRELIHVVLQNIRNCAIHESKADGRLQGCVWWSVTPHGY